MASPSSLPTSPMEPRDITAEFDGIKVSRDRPPPVTDLNALLALGERGIDPEDIRSAHDVSAEISAAFSECMSRCMSRITYVEREFFKRFHTLVDAADRMRKMIEDMRVEDMRDDVERIKRHLDYVRTNLSLPLPDY